jgi:hypothetical protein
MNPSHSASGSTAEVLSRKFQHRLLCVATAFCMAGLLGACGGSNSAEADAPAANQAQQQLEEASDDGRAQALARAPAEDAGREANYFRLTKDTRSCAAPACGGVYATTMNTNVQITCPNGETSATCYVGQLDTAALGYSPFDASNGESVKVKGTLTAGSASSDGVRYGNMVVENVFLPVATTARLMHHLYVITDNGLECPTRPCLKFNSKLANRSRNHDVSSFDLSRLELTALQRRDFRRALNSGQELLIQVGPGQNIQTENGVDVREGVLGLFMPVAAISNANASASSTDGDR